MHHDIDISTLGPIYGGKDKKDGNRKASSSSTCSGGSSSETSSQKSLSPPTQDDNNLSSPKSRGSVSPTNEEIKLSPISPAEPKSMETDNNNLFYPWRNENTPNDVIKPVSPAAAEPVDASHLFHPKKSQPNQLTPFNDHVTNGNVQSTVTNDHMTYSAPIISHIDNPLAPLAAPVPQRASPIMPSLGQMTPTFTEMKPTTLSTISMNDLSGWYAPVLQNEPQKPIMPQYIKPFQGVL